MSTMGQKAWIQVWDPIVRYGHWALVAAFALAYLSAEEESGGPDQLHVWGGYAVGIIVALRVLWGLVGTRHARFSDFAYSPLTALKYIADMLRGHARRYVGHSPAAAVMIAALLFCLAATVGTGLVAYGDSGKGPLATARGIVTAQAHAEEGEGRSESGAVRRGEGGAGIVGDLHGTLANITLGLVILHILGVGVASVMHRENLVGAMFSGRKRAGDES
jgi:cytochrome b